jgi:hypothetical protein
MRKVMVGTGIVPGIETEIGIALALEIEIGTDTDPEREAGTDKGPVPHIEEKDPSQENNWTQNQS